MRRFRTVLWLFSVAALAAALEAQEPDSMPSLGDVARQARLEKQKQATDAPSKDLHLADSSAGKNTFEKTGAGKDRSSKSTPLKTAKKVITNDEIPEHVGPTSTLPAHPKTAGVPGVLQNYGTGKIPAEYWKGQIQAMKDSIANLQDQIKDLAGSIQYSSSNCLAGCGEWNQQQREKEEQIGMMKAQMERQQKSLEQVQEMARKQGFGSSVYDP